MQSTFRPALPLFPQGLKTRYRLFLDRRVPQQSNQSSVGQKTKAEIQVIGDGVFIETTTGLEHGAFDQLSVPPQFGHACIGQAA